MLKAMFGKSKKTIAAREAQERAEREACRKQAIATGINPDSVSTLSGHTNAVVALTALSDGRLASNA